MVCFHPINAFLPFKSDSDGKTRLIFNPRIVEKYIQNSRFGKLYAIDDTIKSNDKVIINPNYVNDGEIEGCLIKVPCGKCLGCKMTYARRWSFRNYHEGYMADHFKNCCFVTLTFNNEQLRQRKNPYSLDKLEFRSWFKRFREAVREYYGVTNVRFFACGEYGSKKGRPHYHLLIYGFNFPDKYLFKGCNCPESLRQRTVNDQVYSYYRSPFLEKLWKPTYNNNSFGFSVIGNLNYETCAYVSRYILKKNTFKYKEGQEPEFTLCSRMPGIGAEYFDHFYKNIVDIGYLQLPSGHKCDIPRYYVDRLQYIDCDLHYKLKLDKKQILLDNLFVDDKDCTEARLLTREQCLNVKLEKYVRNYELDSDLHNIYN